MSIKSKLFRWGVLTPLAIVGIVAIVLLIANTVAPADDYFGKGITTTSNFYGGEIMMEEAMVSSYAAPRAALDYEEAYYDTAAEVSQKIIKTGNLTLVVNTVTETVEQITSYTASLGGFIQNSSLYEHENGTHSGYITIRIPAEQFESALETIKGYANFVENESISGTDVTEEYTDYLSRLTNAQAEETAYLAVLDRADTVEDILAVQAALSDVREEIEVLEGRLKYLEDRTSLSTLSIYLSEEATVTIPGKEFRPWTTAKEAARAFVGILQNIATGLIWIIIVGGGILLPLALLIWLIWLLIKKTCKKKCKDLFKKKRH